MFVSAQVSKGDFDVTARSFSKAMQSSIKKTLAKTSQILIKQTKRNIKEMFSKRGYNYKPLLSAVRKKKIRFLEGKLVGGVHIFGNGKGKEFALKYFELGTGPREQKSKGKNYTGKLPALSFFGIAQIQTKNEIKQILDNEIVNEFKKL